MTAPKNWIIEHIKFTPAGGSEITFAPGLTSISWSIGGQRLTWSGDGAPVVQAQAMEDIDGAASLVTTDLEQAHNANLAIGTVGQLEVGYRQRASGRGAVSGQSKTATAAEAMIMNLNADIPHRGGSALGMDFGAVAADGVADPFALSA